MRTLAVKVVPVVKRALIHALDGSVRPLVGAAAALPVGLPGGELQDRHAAGQGGAVQRGGGGGGDGAGTAR